MQAPFTFEFPAEFLKDIKIISQATENNIWQSKYTQSMSVILPQLEISRQSLSAYLFYTEFISTELKEPIAVRIVVKEPYICFVYVIDGEVVTVDPKTGKDIVVPKGFCFANYIPAGDYPLELVPGKSSAAYFSIRSEFMQKVISAYPELSALIGQHSANPSQPVLLPPRGLTMNTKKQLTELKIYQNTNPLSVENDILRVIQNLIDDYISNLKSFDPDIKRSKEEIVHAVNEYIISETRKGAKLYVADIPVLFHISYFTLLNKFKQIYGITLQEFLLREQIKRAHELLSSGNFKTKDVSIMMGYADSITFARAFKQQFGYRPSEVKIEQDNIK